MKKRHHTIPQCYLKNFADPTGQLWVLDKKDKIFNTQPANILVESHFYTITLKNGDKSVIIEDTLSNIESAFTEIFRDKISQDKFLSTDERAKMSIFFAAMFHRTAPQRASMQNMLKKLRESMEEWRAQFKTLTPEARNRLNVIPPGNGPTLSIEELDKGLENFNEHHSSGLIGWIADTAQIIFDMKWSIWKYPVGKGAFVTSDDPLVIRRPASEKKYGKKAFGSLPGLLYKDSEITLPLSKDRLLLAGWILNEDSYCTPPTEMAEGINQRTILHSSERIIASSKNQLEEIRVKYPPNLKKG